eukprot:s189_g4.t1
MFRAWSPLGSLGSLGPLGTLGRPLAAMNSSAQISSRSFSSKGYKIRRVRYPWKTEVQKMTWELLKQDMVSYFQNVPERDSTVHIRADPWPRFTMKEFLLEKDLLPGVISKYGPNRKVTFNKNEMEAIAFDEPNGHLSNLFKGRLFRVYIGKWIEECVVTDVSTHPVEQELMFVRFDRHIPGRMTVVPIPVSISGLWGCPGYRKGGHVEVALPTVNCEVVGEKIPPPLVVDVSHLQLEQPFGKITLRDMLPLLPPDGTVRFSREYSMDEEVITCYDPKALGEVPLPHDWQDPNFNHRGGRYHLTYTGFWPKQTTRS